MLLYHSLGEHDGEFGTWAFHKGGNGGFTQVLARAAAGVRRRDPARGAGRAGPDHEDGRATGVALADGTEFHADVVVSALDPRRTFLELVEPRELPDDLVEDIRRLKFQGVSSKVNFALDGAAAATRRWPSRERHLPRLPEHRPVDRLPRAGLRRRQVRLVQRRSPYIDGAIQSTIDPDMAPPGKHVMSCFVQYTPYQLRESDWDAERERLGDTVQAHAGALLPRLRRPRPAARGASRRSTSSA